MKVRTLMFSLLVLLVAVPILLLGMYNISSYHNQMKDILENDIGVINDMQVQAIEDFLEERAKNAAVISDTFSMGAEIKSNSEITAEQQMKMTDFANDLLIKQDNTKEFVNGICVLDTDYNVIASSVDVPKEFIQKIKDMSMDGLGDTLKFVPQDYSAFSSTDGKSLIASREIYSKNNLVGYLTMELSMNFFEKVRSTIRPYNNSTVYLLDENRKIIVAGDKNTSRTEYVLTENERKDFTRAMSEEDFSKGKGVLRYKARGNNIISSYSTVDSTGWLLLVSVDVDESLKTKQRFFYLLILVTAICILLLMGSGYIISLKIAKPLENIIEKFEYIKKNKDYSVRIEVPKKNEIGVIIQGINGLLSSVELHMAQEAENKAKLLERVLRDPLTGLYNKKAMDKLIAQRYDECAVANAEMALCYLDIDDFKHYNTQYGHSNGDEVLQYVANIIKAHEECAARVGGDEFVICITDGQKLHDIEYIAKDIIATLNVGMEFADEDITVNIGCCIGIAIVNAGAVSTREMIDIADKAMYKVKNENKNGILILKENDI